MKRNRRAGVEDRWYRADGKQKARYGVGMRWRARYVDEYGREHTKAFTCKVDATHWLNNVVSEQVTGTWTDPKLSGVTFGMMADRWLSPKPSGRPRRFAGYRSLLDTVVLSRWRDVPLREVRFEAPAGQSRRWC
jgi:hypothetical protein